MTFVQVRRGFIWMYRSPRLVRSAVSSDALFPLFLSALRQPTTFLQHSIYYVRCYSTQYTVDMIASDTCEWKYDGECDASTIYCAADTDCFDCDPCRVHRDDCTACLTANPLCGYCQLPSGAGVCLSMGYVDFIPDLCTEDGGSEWITSASSASDQCGALQELGGEASCDRSVCEYEYDAECDVGLFCPSNTDCFDCDPCQLYSASCEGCLSEEGCQFGYMSILSRTQRVCSSEANAAAATASSLVDVVYVASCDGSDGGGNTPAGSPSEPLAPTPALDYSCDYGNDSCRYQLDGVCDAGTVFCRRGSDCLDCDPCLEHRFGGCEACTAAGCAWCPGEALCLSTGFDASGFPDSLTTCTAASDFVTTCEATPEIDDPLYDSQSWLFDMVNVKEAWDMGYSKWMHALGCFSPAS